MLILLQGNGCRQNGFKYLGWHNPEGCHILLLFGGVQNPDRGVFKEIEQTGKTVPFPDPRRGTGIYRVAPADIFFFDGKPIFHLLWYPLDLPWGCSLQKPFCNTRVNPEFWNTEKSKTPEIHRNSINIYRAFPSST
jgi:hypothetical protein